jgi:hypothetical protein
MNSKPRVWGAIERPHDFGRAAAALILNADLAAADLVSSSHGQLLTGLMQRP